MYEINTCKKNPLKVKHRVGLVFPNIYKVAMSNLGYHIIYNILNDREDTYCERFTYPNFRSLETGSPLKDFDIISFSLQYEEDYFNVLKILEESNIPLHRKDRDENHPLIIAGGPSATSNPHVLSDFIDIFIIGDGEKILEELFNNIDKGLEYLKNIDGIYIPEFNNKVELQIVENMDEAYTCKYPIITKTENDDFKPAFGEAILLNISRGCSRGCRFCMSTYLYRPQRESKLEKLVEYCFSMRKEYGLNKVALIGAAVSDYSKIQELIETLEDKGFLVSVPSMRIESITTETLEKLKSSGMKTLTIAPETIPSLRDKINKNIDDTIIFNLIKNAVKLGFNLKYYFLIGLPYETDKDIESLIEYIKKIENMKKYNKSVKMSFSINPLIPKPHTPIQWFKYDYKLNKKKIKYMQKELKGLDIKFDSARMGLIQYNLSCGNKDTGKLIEDSLKRKISTHEWMNITPEYNINDELPWDNVKVRASKEFLKEEYCKIKKGELTPWCEESGCYNCGFC